MYYMVHQSVLVHLTERVGCGSATSIKRWLVISFTSDWQSQQQRLPRTHPPQAAQDVSHESSIALRT